MKKNKRRLSAVLLLLIAVLYLTGVSTAFCEPADAAQEEKDPYDWTDYEGEVILDDPEFFMTDENADNEIVPDEDTGNEAADGADNENKPASEESGQQENGDTENSEEEPASPTEAPSAETSPTEAPDSPTEEPPQEETQPTDAPTTQPEQPTDLQSLFYVEIKTPAGWFNLPEKTVRIKITPQSDVLWSKILYRMDDGDWTEIHDKFTLQDGYYYADLTVTANGKMGIRLMNEAGDYFDTTKEVRIFDHRAPEVTAGIKDTMLHVVAADDLSEVAGIQVNGLLFTTLEDGVLDVRMEDVLLTYRQLAIRAYDYAGNFSDPVTLDNPYYTEPTPTKRPASTKKPTATPTAAPTATTKPTKKPSGGSSVTQETEKPKATKAPVTEAPASTEKQEPIVIILTPPPTAVPAPTATPEIQYVPLGPGQPFTQHGNMATRDVLYSASTNKQFISVQSRNGQTYYLVIDYDKPIDEANEIYETYFLNLVDDRDLMSVLTDEEIIPTPTPQIIYVTPEPTQVLLPTSVPTEAPVQQETRKMDSATMLLLLLIALVIGGFAAWFITSQRKRQTPRIPEYDEDEEIEDSEDDASSDSSD